MTARYFSATATTKASAVPRGRLAYCSTRLAARLTSEDVTGTSSYTPSATLRRKSAYGVGQSVFRHRVEQTVCFLANGHAPNVGSAAAVGPGVAGPPRCVVMVCTSDGNKHGRQDTATDASGAQNRR